MAYQRRIEGGGVWRISVDNSQESHKPVETGDLRAKGASRSREALEVQTGPPKPSGAISEPEKGTCASGPGGGGGGGGRHSIPARRVRLSGSFAFSPGLFGVTPPLVKNCTIRS